MRFFSIFYLILAALCVSYREFQLTENLNGACFLADTAGNETSIQFSVLATTLNLPLIIFDYLHVYKVKDLPNLNDFLNQTYIDGKLNKLIRRNSDDSFGFKLRPAPGFTTVPDVTTKTLYNNDVVSIPIEKPGIYCAYIPLPSAKFLIDIELHNDLLPIDTPRHLSAHKKALGVILVAIFSLSFLQSYWNKRSAVGVNFNNNTVVKLLTVLLFSYTAYLILLIAIESLIVNYYEVAILHKIYYVIQSFIYPIERAIYDPIFDAVILFIASKSTTPSKKYYFFIFFYLLSFPIKYYLLHLQVYIPGEFNLQKIVVNDESYDLLYNSIITGFNLSKDVKPRLNTLITPIRLAIAFAYPLAQNGIFPVAIIIGLKNLRGNKSKAFKVTIWGFLIGYSLLIKKAIANYFIPNFIFNGANDFGEVLLVFHDLYGKKIFINFLLKIFDVVIVYLIWAYFDKQQIIAVKSKNKYNVTKVAKR